MPTSRRKFLPAPQEIPHPVLRDRKAIVATALVTRCLDDDIEPPVQSAHDLLVDLRSKGIEAARERASLAADGVRLDQHLQDVEAALDGAWNRHQRIQAAGRAPPVNPACPPEIGGGILASFRGDRRAIDCQRCGRSNGHVCNGTDADHRTMARSPECWSLINDIFTFACDEAERAYVSLVSGFDACPNLEVGLKTAAVDGAIVEATTGFEADESVSARRATVFVDLPRLDFGANQYYGLPYQIFHEVIVHVPQTIFHATPREPHGEDCAFAEGFVDAAAFGILDQALGHHPDPQTRIPPNLVRFRAAFLQRARYLRESRCRIHEDQLGLDDPTRRNAVAARARAFGRELFCALAASRPGERGHQWATQVALTLNIADLGKGVRRDLLLAIRRGWRSPSGAERIAVRSALDAYGETADPGPLLRQLGVA